MENKDKQKSVLEPTVPDKDEVVVVKKSKKERFKNFLLAFFLVEHLAILLILLIPVFFLVRAYAYSDFGQLNEKATNFVPKNKDEVMNHYSEKYKVYVTDFLENKEEKPQYEFEFAEEDVNTMLSDIKLDQIDRFYITFEDGNVVYLWVKPTEIPYPIMFKSTYEYSYQDKHFQFKILDWQVGPLSFPAKILGFVEDTINKDLWKDISNIFDTYSTHLVDAQTSKGLVKIRIQIDDKEKLIYKISQN